MKKNSNPDVRSPGLTVSFPSKPQRNDPETMNSEMFAATLSGTRGESAELPRTVDMNEDVALFGEFLAGDDVAAIKVFRKFHRRLFVYCTKVLGSAEQAEDVVGEVWERVVKLRGNPPEVHNPIGFLLKVARNLCLNSIRARREHTSLSSLAESEHPIQVDVERSELEDRLVAALDSLPFETREIMVLNAYCGYRFDEIATMLDKSPDAVWARASRARAQLRRMVLADSDTKTKKKKTDSTSEDREAE